MVNDAEKFASEDKKCREAVDLRNQAAWMIYQTKKQLEEFKDKVPADVRPKIEGEVAKLEEAMKRTMWTRSRRRWRRCRRRAWRWGRPCTRVRGPTRGRRRRASRVPRAHRGARRGATTRWWTPSSMTASET